ncbi:MAG: hypothetical protein ACTSRN_01250 [Alphaproteobacteria bacterium]
MKMGVAFAVAITTSLWAGTTSACVLNTFSMTEENSRFYSDDFRQLSTREQTLYTLGAVDAFQASLAFGASQSCVDKIQVCLSELSASEINSLIVARVLRSSINDFMNSVIQGEIRRFCDMNPKGQE